MRSLRLTALLLAAVLVLVAGTAGCTGGTATGGDSAPVRVVLLVKLVPKDAVGTLTEGQAVRIKRSGATLGTIESIEVTPTPIPYTGPDGKPVEGPSPLDVDLRITVKGTAVASGAVYSFSGTTVQVEGPAEIFFTPLMLLPATIVSISPAGA